MLEVKTVETRTPIEIALDIDSEGMTTARKLYEFLELAPQHYARWCKSNITENEFAEENVDYWAFTINGNGVDRLRQITGSQLTSLRSYLSRVTARKQNRQGNILQRLRRKLSRPLLTAHSYHHSCSL